MNNIRDYINIVEAAQMGGLDATQRIRAAFDKIYGYGDAGLDYLDVHGQLYSSLQDRYEGDLDAMLANEPPDVLDELAYEMEQVADAMTFDLEPPEEDDEI